VDFGYLLTNTTIWTIISVCQVSTYKPSQCHEYPLTELHSVTIRKITVRKSPPSILRDMTRRPAWIVCPWVAGQEREALTSPNLRLRGILPLGLSSWRYPNARTCISVSVGLFLSLQWMVWAEGQEACSWQGHYCSLLLLCMSRCSSVGLVYGLDRRIGVLLPEWTGDFYFLHNDHTGSGINPASCTITN
jgi:hypothetical protein